MLIQKKKRFLSLKNVLLLVLAVGFFCAALNYVSLIEVNTLKNTPLAIEMMNEVQSFVPDQDWRERRAILTGVVNRYIHVGMDQKTVERVLSEQGFEWRWFTPGGSKDRMVVAEHQDRKMFWGGEEKSFLVIWISYQNGLVSEVYASYTVHK